MNYDNWKLDNNESYDCTCPECECKTNENSMVKFIGKFEVICESCAMLKEYCPKCDHFGNKSDFYEGEIICSKCSDKGAIYVK